MSPTQPEAQNSLGIFTGNVLSQKEKALRMSELSAIIKKGEVDKEFVPYLVRINKCSFVEYFISLIKGGINEHT
jgi:hypothetical protein